MMDQALNVEELKKQLNRDAYKLCEGVRNGDLSLGEAKELYEAYEREYQEKVREMKQN